MKWTDNWARFDDTMRGYSLDRRCDYCFWRLVFGFGFVRISILVVLHTFRKHLGTILQPSFSVLSL